MLERYSKYIYFIRKYFYKYMLTFGDIAVKDFFIISFFLHLSIISRFYWPNCSTYYRFWTLFMRVVCICMSVDCVWSLWWNSFDMKLVLHARHPSYSLFHLLLVWLILVHVILIYDQDSFIIFVTLNGIICMRFSHWYECFLLVGVTVWSGGFA